MTTCAYWVAYDISDDKQRSRVERCVSRYGQRLQKSVFVCVLNTQRHALLLADLHGLGTLKGSVMIGRLADANEVSCVGKSIAHLTENWVFELPVLDKE